MRSEFVNFVAKIDEVERTTHYNHNKLVYAVYERNFNKEATGGRLTAIIVVAGLIGTLSLAVAGLALSVILGAPFVAAAAIGMGLAAFALPTLVGAAVVSALFFTAMGLSLNTLFFVQNLSGASLKLENRVFGKPMY